MAYRETEHIRARKQAVRERIVEAAQALVVEGGFKAAQMVAVAERARVATGTLYRYFPTQADLFVELFREHTQREVAIFTQAVHSPGTTSERLAHAVRQFSHRALHAPRLAYALIAEPSLPEVEGERLRYRRAYADALLGLIESGMAAGELTPQDARVSANALVGGLAEVLLGPLAVHDAASAEQVIDQLVNYSIRAVGAQEVTQ